MTNADIADNLSLLAKLMDIHGENPFKIKTYSNAAFQLEKITVPLSEMDQKAIARIKGVGDSVAEKIGEMIVSGKFSLLEDLIAKTPAGVLEMMNIKGIGPKKINIIWKEMEIESLGELLYACNENRLTLYKGFGQKTQENIKNAINFYLSQEGLFLYQQAEAFVNVLTPLLQQLFTAGKVKLTGEFLRQNDVIETIEYVIAMEADAVETALQNQAGFAVSEVTEAAVSCNIENGPRLMLYCCEADELGRQLFLSSGTTAFNDAFIRTFGAEVLEVKAAGDDKAIFKAAGIPYILPCLRQNAESIDLAVQNKLPDLIRVDQIKGIIHSHSNWSDGASTLPEMARGAIEKGFEYLVISDHSRSAGYANGLSAERVAAQHQEIEALNKKLAPFKIFKSIESDILNDGSLDYPAELLNTFDIVIASVHSGLKMPQEKAMMRLMKAIENPFTSILGHMTGRLLISRNGYPVDHKAIIAACVAHDVVIELNAHPRRLDMDWSWIAYALEQGATISVNPDAHAIEGFDDVKYGVIAAQKGRLTAANNLSSYTLAEFETFVLAQQKKRSR